jgi:hypothetical protein
MLTIVSHSAPETENFPERRALNVLPRVAEVLLCSKMAQMVLKGISLPLLFVTVILNINRYNATPQFLFP